MTTIDDQGRPEPPIGADEVDTLLGFLDYQRSTLRWKTERLDAAAMSATVGVSTMTLGGLLKHLALVEDHWFTNTLLALDMPAPWDAIDWKATPDWEWHTAGGDSPDQLQGIWLEAVERSRAAVTQALTEGGLGQRARRAWPDGQAPNLRWILTHMIEEYARHNGHADLLRELVDGETGE